MEHKGKEYRSIPGYDKYFVSVDGEILSVKKKTPRILKHIEEKGDEHEYVFLYKEPQKMSKMYVHRAILSAWVRPPKDGEVGRHINDNPKDNRLENLAWGTVADNMADKIRNGGQRRGEDMTQHILTEETVMDIRRQCSQGVSSTDMAIKHGVSKSTVLEIVRGNSWSHLPIIQREKYPSSARRNPYSEEELKASAERLRRYAASIKKPRIEVPCECGCGMTIITPDSHGRERRYVHGHGGGRQRKDGKPRMVRVRV